MRIKNGFEARGLITIQNPASVVLILLIYIMLLFRLGKAEMLEVEDLNPAFVLPEKCFVEATRISTTKDADIYDSRISGSIRARDIYVSRSEVFGSLRGREIILDSSTVHGNVTGKVIYN